MIIIIIVVYRIQKKTHLKLAAKIKGKYAQCTLSHASLEMVLDFLLCIIRIFFSFSVLLSALNHLFSLFCVAFSSNLFLIRHKLMITFILFLYSFSSDFYFVLLHLCILIFTVSLLLLFLFIGGLFLFSFLSCQNCGCTSTYALGPASVSLHFVHSLPHSLCFLLFLSLCLSHFHTDSLCNISYLLVSVLKSNLPSFSCFFFVFPSCSFCFFFLLCIV